MSAIIEVIRLPKLIGQSKTKRMSRGATSQNRLFSGRGNPDYGNPRYKIDTTFSFLPLGLPNFEVIQEGSSREQRRRILAVYSHIRRITAGLRRRCVLGY